MSKLAINDPAPDFEATLTSGETLRLRDLTDRFVVLYFYPRDNTPGCTTEARDFQALLPEFEKQGARVIGVSQDSPASHRKFCDKQGLTFDLISDEDGRVCTAYDVLKPKKVFGKSFVGIVRATFLIDGDGTLRAIWPKVKVDGHAMEVLETIKRIRQA